MKSRGGPSRTFLVLALALALDGCAAAPPRPALAQVVLATVDGEPFAFWDRRSDVLLVTFFATWCFPCLAEIPDLVALQRRFGRRGFSIVAVGVDPQGARVLRPFRDFYRLPYPVLVADAEMLEGRTPFGAIRAFPTAFLVGRDGRVAFSYAGTGNPLAVAEAVENALR